MHVIKAADCKRMPWKNGAGETVEIAIAPIGAGLDDFEWRLSMAHVDTDGPFSAFAGVDRTLAVADGEGLTLSILGRGSITLTKQSEPLTFAGDPATSAVRVNGRVTDLNVMTRRGRFQHRMERLDISGSLDVKVDATVALLVCVTRGVRVEAQGGVARLGPLDTARLDGLSGHVLVVAESRASRCYLIQLERC
jgi:environmental stress-induced protein Ves